jgi:hypothetical protein
MDIFSENKLVSNMDHYDAFTYALVGPISILASLSFILLNIYFKDARKFPGNLLIIISVGELFLAIHWFMSGVYSKYIWGVHFIEESSNFCIINTYIACLAANVQYVFQLSFLLSIIVMFKNTMKKIKSQKLFIIIPIILIIASTSLTAIKNKLGKNIYGTCSVKNSNGSSNVVIALGLIIVYLIFVIFTLVVLRRFKKNTSKSLKIKNSDEFYWFYMNYSIMMLIYYIIIALNFIFATKLQIFLDENENQCYENCMILYYMCRLTNNVKVMLPLFSFLLRINDPFIKQMIFNFLNQKFKGKSGKLDESMTNLYESSTILKPLNSMSVDNKDFIVNQTINRIRMLCTRTMLFGLYKYYKVIMKRINSMKSSDDVLDKIEIALEDLIDMGDIMGNKDLQNEIDRMERESSLTTKKKKSEKFAEEIDDLNNRLTNPEFSSGIIRTKSKKFQKRKESKKENKEDSLPDENLNGDMQVFHAKDFSKLIIQRGHHLREIEQAFEVGLNKKCIKKMGKSKTGGGGASGEFFFVTHDGRYFIKTITEEEEDVFLDMVDGYITHLLENKNSLIGRIIGYFVFKFDILDQPIKVIIIENIFLIEKTLVRRKYDLKGSTYKRKVLKAGDNRMSVNHDLKNEFTEQDTLKDLDFNKIEGKIVLSNEVHRELLNLMYEDVSFFRKSRVIDYSLIIAVVKMTDIEENYNEDERHLIKQQINILMEKKMFFMDSQLEFGYLVGIIDYFQKFTIGKALEKYMKILVNCKLGLDTSSQPPEKYALRYIKYMQEIFISETEYLRDSKNDKIENRKVGHSFNLKETIHMHQGRDRPIIN